ncbi:toprim domain-containing protein [Psychromarinibacter sp. C21-152]|uniref:Toprim domain-containing protein n=1 Tax=Psychromarinibacter sediminicola TaxID=3033385 RepID=A0AAE3NU80_9RHOB|nr:toprim domain-containing protein [Psychromarinibacter sediminicola]MDF0602157.1 toprim domain-containing protein [Psychromarinibacter sediminicola]
MTDTASDITRRLAREAEAVCRHYLSNGRRQGRYWIVGDARNTPGRSLYVRLTGPTHGPGAAGKWADAATGEHGDLLDLIAATQHLHTFCETLDEARRFLSLPRPEPQRRERQSVPAGSPEAARRLFAIGRPISGTLAERYLHRRGLAGLGDAPALRFHPHCYYWREGQPKETLPETWPALLAKVTDGNGNLTGIHRTWLDPATARKAPLDPPRKAMGNLLGHGVRIGAATDILAAGEGLESTLSLRMALPDLPVIAALSANHLAALILPAGLRRLYIAADADEAGAMAADKLTERADAVGIETVRLSPIGDDFNEDLRKLGREDLRAHLGPQLATVDLSRLLSCNP